MNEKHRKTAAVAGGLALALALAGCAPGTGQTDAPAAPAGEISTDISQVGEVTLTVWDQEVRGGQNEQIEQLNAAFEELYPNVTIERNSQAFDDLATTLRLAWAGESRGETMSFAAATGRPSSAGSSPDRKTRKRRLVTGPGIVQSASVCWLVSSTRPGPYVAA